MPLWTKWNVTLWTEIQVSTKNLIIPSVLLLGAKQKADTEGPGACHAAAPARVHAGAGVPPSQHHPEDALRADPAPAPDRAHQPAGIQQAPGAGAAAQARHGGPTAAQELEGTKWCRSSEGTKWCRNSRCELVVVEKQSMEKWSITACLQCRQGRGDLKLVNLKSTVVVIRVAGYCRQATAALVPPFLWKALLSSVPSFLG